jgi:hypothetical protein
VRQFGCIEVTQTDALLLRDAIRPLSKVEPFEPATVIRFCEKLYDGILKMKTNDMETINISLEEQEALFINQFVGNEDWASALAILEQTWLVLYELRNEQVYPRPERPVAADAQQDAEGEPSPIDITPYRTNR